MLQFSMGRSSLGNALASEYINWILVILVIIAILSLSFSLPDTFNSDLRTRL